LNSKQLDALNRHLDSGDVADLYHAIESLVVANAAGENPVEDDSTLESATV
jgi:hypothetical protein